jgi:hypothetical protein
VSALKQPPDGRGSLSRETFCAGFLSLVLICVLFSCVAAKAETVGWVTLGFWGVLFVVPVLHAGFHLRAVSGIADCSRWLGFLVFLSHLALVLAFFLQYDYADDGPGWLTITALLNRDPFTDGHTVPSWWWPHGLSLNWIVMVPVVASWVLLVRKGLRRGEGVKSWNDATQVWPLFLAGLFIPLAAVVAWFAYG